MSESEDPVLDPAVIDALLALEQEGAPGLFNELVDLFVSDTPDRLEGLEAALEADNAQGVEEIAHSLKSSCGNLGAASLAELFRQIEVLGRERKLEGVDSLLSESQERYAQVEKALDDARS